MPEKTVRGLVRSLRTMGAERSSHGSHSAIVRERLSHGTRKNFITFFLMWTVSIPRNEQTGKRFLKNFANIVHSSCANSLARSTLIVGNTAVQPMEMYTLVYCILVETLTSSIHWNCWKCIGAVLATYSLVVETPPKSWDYSIVGIMAMQFWPYHNFVIMLSSPPPWNY